MFTDLTDATNAHRLLVLAYEDMRMYRNLLALLPYAVKLAAAAPAVVIPRRGIRHPPPGGIA